MPSALLFRRSRTDGLDVGRGVSTVYASATSNRGHHVQRSPKPIALGTVQYQGRCNSYPAGAILLTGTGVVPPDEFTLAPDDVLAIRIEGIGELTNTVTTVHA